MKKLSIKEKFMYGLGDLSGNIMFSAISFFLLFFIVNVGGLKPYLAGIVFIIARFWDAITDYMMGRISDKTKSKFGKRKVYMIFGALPYGLMFIFLWIVPNTSTQMYKFIYYTLAYILYNTTWTIVYIPYNALTANMTDDYDERTSLNAYRIVLANVGILLGAAVFALLADGKESIFYTMFGSEKIAYLLSGTIFGILAFMIMIVCTLGVKERNQESELNPSGFFKTLKEFFSLKEFRNIITYYVLSMIGFDIIMAVFIFFVNDTLGFGGGSESMLFVAIPLVVAMISAPLWVSLSNKFSKHKVYGISVVFISIVLLFCLGIPSGNYLTLILVCTGAGIGMSAIQILPFSSIPDVVEVDEYYHGYRREGSYYGITQFMYKFASGLAVAIVSAVLSACGYVENAPLDYVQPSSALLAIRIILGVLPGLIFLTSIIFAYKANLGRENFDQIKIKIKQRKGN